MYTSRNPLDKVSTYGMRRLRGRNADVLRRAFREPPSGDFAHSDRPPKRFRRTAAAHRGFLVVLMKSVRRRIKGGPNNRIDILDNVQSCPRLRNRCWKVRKLTYRTGSILLLNMLILML
ncbi:hypothetical protein EVAR_19966_1 [Eumeta japonica]|uniref:Uncharacterized protein n=1 Tax=Eumeta variegata TaxID=151549 RepID=A0A4C1YLP6_EUMVA|nr:hypothetical protein EVAR_19966_1 [Eumeta japonica]